VWRKVAEHSAIEWTDATWNPWYGCTKVSPGCKYCYAESWAKRTGRDFSTVTRSKSAFNAPLKWKTPRRIFTCSLSDFFHPDADRWRDEAWGIIKDTPHHTYLILTKRIDLFRASICPDNVWLGVTAENQAQWDSRVPLLLNTPATIRWVSVEPMLGPIVPVVLEVDWLVVGGESGPKRRPIEPSWVRYLRDECKAAGVPFFFKQWGGRTPKAGGCELDGREWKEFPA
jgi:protein gp37